MTLLTGKELGEAGALAAAAHADRVHQDWTMQAYEFLRTFAPTRSCFLGEDVRLAAAEILPDPPDRRAWGAVIRQAAKAGKIRRIGYAAVRDRRSHGCPKSVWVWVA